MTLDDYFKAAKLKLTVPFAPFIELKFPPMKHQISGLNKLLTNDYYGLYDQPGTGKTMISHGYSLYWMSEGQRTIAVMPPNLCYQYKDELFDVFIGAEKYLDLHILNNPPVRRKKLYDEWEENDSWPQILCMSYQMFAKEYKKLMGVYRVGVFDEAQALKNPEKDLFKKSKEWQEQDGGSSATYMTGTPIHNELIDAYALIELTTPGEYASFEAFDRIHCVYQKIRLKNPIIAKSGKKIRQIKKRTGYHNVGEINKSLYLNARRILKKDVSEIRDPVITEVPVILESAHLTLYKKLVRERMLEIGEELLIATNPQALRQSLLQIVTCPELYTEDMKFKNNVVQTCKTLIDAVEIHETKVIMFVNFKNSVKTMAKYFDEYNPALMYGDSNSEANRQKFLNDDTCRLLIANCKSAGAGFNFQDQCHNVIFAEPTGVPGDFKQAIDRVVRHGQENLVNVWIVKALSTISPKATKEMRRKEGQAQEVYKDSHSFLEDFKVA